MRKYIKFILITFIMLLIIFEAIIISIIKFPGGTFYDSYTNLISDKYRLLQETNESKIVLVSGSSGAFGLDQKLLEESTGYKVINLGLHGGFGHLFYSELAKENVNPGDIILLAYEYGWEEDDGFATLGQELIMTGIDDNIDMYKHIPVAHWKDFIGYIFKYAELKRTYTGSSGMYSREAFDSKTTQMTIGRQYTMDYDNYPENYGIVDLNDGEISDRSVEYLLKLKKYFEKKGANVYFVSPPVLDKAVKCDYEEFLFLKEEEEKRIGIPYISNPEDYFFPSDLMCDYVYHCNVFGEQVRTELLIEDLRRASVIE